MLRFRVNKNARMTVSLLASAAFIGLAIWGWGLPVETAIRFFIICLTALVAIVVSAALVGLAVSAIRTRLNKS